MTSLLSDTPTPLTDAASVRTGDALLGAHSADAYAELMHEVVDAPLRVRLERDHGDRANQSDHVGREPGNQSICRISLWPK